VENTARTRYRAGSAGWKFALESTQDLSHQIPRHPESEPGAPDALGGKKRLKDSLQRLLIHARPCIGNGDANSFAAIL
jgi:hypothetical protein